MPALLDTEPDIAKNRYTYYAVNEAVTRTQSRARINSKHLDQVIKDNTQRNMRTLGIDLSTTENSAHKLSCHPFGLMRSYYYENHHDYIRTRSTL
jgi:hypothetical protein